MIREKLQTIRDVIMYVVLKMLVKLGLLENKWDEKK